MTGDKSYSKVLQVPINGFLEKKEMKKNALVNRFRMMSVLPQFKKLV